VGAAAWTNTDSNPSIKKVDLIITEYIRASPLSVRGLAPYLRRSQRAFQVRYWTDLQRNFPAFAVVHTAH